MNEKDNKSEAWIIVSELGRQNKRIFTALIIVIIMWFATIGSFVWYLNQYEFTTEIYDVNSEDGGFAGYIGNNGDMYNGTSDSY